MHDDMQLDEYGALVPIPRDEMPCYNRFFTRVPSAPIPENESMSEPLPSQVDLSTIQSTVPIAQVTIPSQAEMPASLLTALEEMAQQREQIKRIGLRRRKSMQVAYVSFISVVLASASILFFAHVFHQPTAALVAQTTATPLPLRSSQPMPTSSEKMNAKPFPIVRIHHSTLSIKPHARPTPKAHAAPAESQHLAERNSAPLARISPLITLVHHPQSAPLPHVVDFYAIPHSLYAGQNIEVCIRVANAVRAQVINFPHPWLVQAEGLDCRRTSPKKTTRYTAWVINAQGIKIRRRLLVKVFHAPWMLARVHRFENDLDKFDPAQAAKGKE